MPKSMHDFWNAQAEWSRATFGSDQERGPLGPLKHLKKEIDKELLPEVEAGGRGDLIEYVDAQFLIFDACRRAGYTYEQFLEAAWTKLDINRARQWQKPASPDEPVEHVR